ncbi:MAG: acyloxyacyl hydrolase [Chlamydiota bacterium]
MIKIIQWFFLLLWCFQGYLLSDENRFLKSKSDNPSLIAFGVGDYNLLRSNPHHKTALLQLEYKGPDFFGKKILKIRPFAALMGTFQGSVWVGAGVNFDINFGRPIVVTLGFGPGLFCKGFGKDLGYPLEMRSSIELAYRFPSQKRLGLQFYHLSNGSLSRRNPGVEALVLFYAIPI